MRLDKLPFTPNRLKKSKRLGCGRACGHGETSTRGNKGGNARSGYSTPHNFSGIPWYRKFPKRGFNNSNFKKLYHVVNLGLLDSVLPADFSAIVDRKVLLDLKLIDEDHLPIKVLGNGEWKRSLSFRVDKVSEGAKTKIEAVGGKVLSA